MLFLLASVTIETMKCHESFIFRLVINYTLHGQLMSVSIHNKSFAELVSMKELKKYVISDMSQPQARR